MRDFEKIAADTYMRRVDGRICGTVYAIVKGKRHLVIDSGDGKEDLGFEPDVCILTHGHFDHTQGVKESWKRVLLHPAEFGFPGPYIKIPKIAKPNPMSPIVFEGHELEFFHTPGHTDGSICVFDRKTRLLFTGDTKFAGGICGRVDLGGDAEKMNLSLRLIESIPYRLLCPGHGELEWRDEK